MLKHKYLKTKVFTILFLFGFFSCCKVQNKKEHDVPNQEKVKDSKEIEEYQVRICYDGSHTFDTPIKVTLKINLMAHKITRF